MFDNSFISEMTNCKEIKLGLKSQTIEYDADCCAAVIGLQLIIDKYRNKDKLPEIVIPYFNSLEDVIFLWTFSAYTIFRLLGSCKYDFNRLDKYPHPYPGFRQYFMIKMINRNIYASEYSSSIESIASKATTATYEFENVIKIIKDESIIPEFIKTIHPPPISHTFTDIGRNHIFKILDNWNNVRPELEPYSMVKLSPITKSADLKKFMDILKTESFF
jgi:hypothetical protein